jgi:hypothetical protein
VTRHVVQFSSGVGSYLAACRVAERHGTAEMVLLFADVRTEDEDNYRFLHQAAARLGVPATTVTEGRTPQQAMRDEHFLGNARFTPCTKLLKLEPCRAWLLKHADPADTILYVGIDWSETRRRPGIENGWAPWPVRFPMCDPPHLTKAEMLEQTRRHGIEPPRMYAQGFSHANCAGACVRGGHAHWTRLLAVNPELFASWEAFEAEMRTRHGDVAILRRQQGGVRTPYPLTQLRHDLTAADGPRQPTLPGT